MWRSERREQGRREVGADLAGRIGGGGGGAHVVDRARGRRARLSSGGGGLRGRAAVGGGRRLLGARLGRDGRRLEGALGVRVRPHEVEGRRAREVRRQRRLVGEAARHLGDGGVVVARQQREVPVWSNAARIGEFGAVWLQRHGLLVASYGLTKTATLTMR